jgi:hypothetical protein
MTRAEAEARITNLIRTRNLILLAIQSDANARTDAAATLEIPPEQIDNVSTNEMLLRVRRSLWEAKEVVYDDAKTNGQI